MDAVHELKALSELGQQEKEAADPVAAARQDHHKLCDRRALCVTILVGWAHSLSTRVEYPGCRADAMPRARCHAARDTVDFFLKSRSRRRK